VSRLLAAEWRKVATLRWWKIALPLLLGADVGVTLLLFLGEPVLVVSDSEQQRHVLSHGLGAGVILAWLLAVGLVGGEHSTGMLATTFLVEPVRERVLLAKLLFAVLLGGVAGCVEMAVTALAAAAALATRGSALHVTAGLGLTVLGGVLVTVFSTALFFGLGAAVRSRWGAVALLLVYGLVIEPLLAAVARATGGDWDRFLLFEVLTAVQPPSSAGLTMALATWVAAAYAAVAVAVGWTRITLQDVA
jgi:ABC-2 type transport system permease protein